MSSVFSIKNSDMRYFEAAHREAEKSDFPRFHVGCVVVYKGSIIASAHNSNKSDPKQKKYNRYRHFNHTTKTCVNHSGHAEMIALKKVTYPIAQQIDWKEVKLYVVRIAPGLPGGMGLSKPCPSCEHRIRELGIRNIYYTGNGSYIHERLIYD